MSTIPSRTVLIVDDRPDDRAVLRHTLHGTGNAYTVLEAETGADGLRQIREATPDCVLLDLGLPDMTGMEFLERLAGGKPGELQNAVVMLTGLDDAESASAALARGAQDIVVKGTLTSLGLLRVIENAIEKFSIQRELNDKRAILELRNRQLETIRDQLESNLAELVDATRAKDRFMAVMSHEMRTPLNAILGYVDLIELGLAGELSEPQREYIGRIRVGSRHLLDLINDVLDLARADARKLELDLRPVDVVAVAEEVVTLLESQAEATGIELILEPCTETLPIVWADLQRSRQILTNLVGNALKFTEEGSVTVRCTADGEHVRIAVEDTGIGIAPEVMPLIFSEFYQADDDLTRRKGGSGLGLAIAQRLARLMGGDLQVASEPGRGSTFTLVLPRAGQDRQLRPEDVALHAARMEAHRSARLGHERSGEPRAVVVAYGETEEVLRELGRRVQPGVRLVWTTRAEEVAELARLEDASLVVLDIACAKGAGWHAAHDLREDPGLATTALLLLPCIPMPFSEEAASGLDLGWLTLVPKPFTHEQLTRAVYSAALGTSAAGEAEDAKVFEVLIVDDDPDSRRVASKFLASPQVRVREVADGESALLEMRRSPPDVVVLDLMMPVLDGFGVLAAMRADPLLTRLPVVVLSAKSLTEAERQFLARSTVRVLQKGEHRLSDVADLVLRAAAGH
jgi:signal transduction histidine kinase